MKPTCLQKNANVYYNQRRTKSVKYGRGQNEPCGPACSRNRLPPCAGTGYPAFLMKFRFGKNNLINYSGNNPIMNLTASLQQSKKGN